MAITYVGATSSSSDQTGTSISTTLPAHQVGDLIIGWIDPQESIPDVPSGWTSLRQSGFTRAFYRFAADTSTSQTITFPASTLSAWTYVAYRGAGSVVYKGEASSTTASFTDAAVGQVLHLAEGDSGSVIGPATGTTQRAADRRNLSCNAGIFEDDVSSGTQPARAFSPTNRVVTVKLYEPATPDGENVAFSVYQNVGVPPLTPDRDAAFSLYQNVGLAPLTPDRDAAFSLYQNVTVGPKLGTASLTATSSLTAATSVIRVVTVSLTATSTLVAIQGIIVANANLTATATLTAPGVKVRPATSALTATATLTATGSALRVYTLAGEGSLEVTNVVREEHLFARVMILDKTFTQAPMSLTVVVEGGWPEDDVSFAIDGTEVLQRTLDSDGGLAATSIPVPEALGSVGGHTLTMESLTAEIGSQTADTFALTLAPDTPPTPVGGDIAAVVVPEAATVRWVLQDVLPGGLGSYVFPNNPTSMTNPHVKKQLSQTHTTAVNTGRYHISEVAEFSVQWSFTGVCFSQAHHDAMLAFSQLKRRFYIIDHRNRAWTVAALSFDPTARLRSNINGVFTDWAHDYTFTVLVMDQNWTVPG
jgi:hypothetical protein